MAGKTKYKVGDEFPNGKRIIEYCGSDPRFRVSLWMWECMGCGKVHGPSMTSTLTRTKGPRCCYSGGGGRGYGRWNGYEDISGSYIWQCRDGAKSRNIEWSITPEDMWDAWVEQDGKCVYTGWSLTHGLDASLDRIDSSIGYVAGNIQWTHKTINIMKSSATELEFIALCKAVTDFSAGRL